MTKPINTPLDTLQSIRKRRTTKVLSDEALPVKPCDKELIHILIESAYYAPFHYPCHQQYQQENASPLPYRFYVLDSQACRDLKQVFQQANKNMGKIEQMLNAADYLIQATWCPQPKSNNETLFIGNEVNMEHIAAGGAAIQNILLTATALGYENYWSSGGVLKDEFAYQKLGINPSEILLGALFIFPNQSDTPPMTEYLSGKLRDKRGEVEDCYRLLKI